MAKREKKKEINSIDNLISSLDKTFGQGSFFNASENRTIQVEKLSSGSLILNKALGGGYPLGRIIEIYGSESSGKTTLALHAIAEAQKNGGMCAFIDAEHALDIEYAKKLGVDTSKMFISQPDYGEQALEIVDEVVKSNLFSIVVVDSVASLVPKSELEGEMGDQQMGKQARLMSQAMRKLTGNISRTKTIVIFINQTRSKIGVMWGSPTTTTGGNALKFYASQRLEIARTSQIKNGEEVIGHKLKIKVVKNKIAPPFKVAETELIYGKGVSKENEILNLAVQYGIIEKSGSWYKYGDTSLGQGSVKVIETLQDNPDLLEEIENLINEQISSDE